MRFAPIADGSYALSASCWKFSLTANIGREHSRAVDVGSIARRLGQRSFAHVSKVVRTNRPNTYGQGRWVGHGEGWRVQTTKWGRPMQGLAVLAVTAPRSVEEFTDEQIMARLARRGGGGRG